MSVKPAAVAAIGLACLWGQSYAQDATLPHLVSLQGAVLVDHGDGYVSAGPGALLRGGDRVTTAHGGVAKISYADGCTVDLNSRTIATIDSTSPCDGGPAPQTIQAAYQGPPPPDEGPPPYHMGGGLIIGGLAAVGVGIAIGVIIGENEHHNRVIVESASP